MSDSASSTKSTYANSISLVFSLSLVSLYLAFNPSFFSNDFVWNIVFFGSIFISCVGTISEISKYLKHRLAGQPDFNDLLLGLFCVGLFYWLAESVSIDINIVSTCIQIVAILLLLIGSYATINGMHALISTFRKPDKPIIPLRKRLSHFLSLIVSLASFVSSIVAIMQAFGLFSQT